MPISSFYGLQTSLRGLLAQQRSLDVTGHNIANVNTAGYSRQEAALAATPALFLPAGGTLTGSASLGSGVDVTSYRRVRDQFLDLQFRGQASNLGQWSGRADTLQRAEDALAEPGDNGLNTQLGKFWDAWSDLANSPNPNSDPAARQALVERGQAVADTFSQVYDQITTVQQQARAEYDSIVAPAGPGSSGGQIAQIASQIAQLNDTIKRQTASGDSPNDLLDQRDQLLDQLSTFGQISVEKQGSGAVNVSFVDTASAGTTYSVVSDTTATWAGPPAGDAWSPGGRAGGLLEAVRPGGTLDGYLSSLDGVASSLTSAVNGAYGGTFLESSDPAHPAGSLRVTPAIVAAPSTITAGLAGQGANDIALRVSQLRDGATDGAYRTFVTKLGTDVQEANRQVNNAQALTDSVDDRRSSVAGVSLDEEMTNMIKFQRSYQAASRAMSTMDEMLDVLINRTGRVGV
jgi:flagellar hook-associated protein 1